MAGNKVIFEVATELEMNGRQLKALKPDKDGIYKGIPLTVIGQKSRNNVYYDPQSVIQCMTDPNSRFVMNLKSGDLEGEWGHPLLSSKDPNEIVGRLLYLDRKCVSHHFTRVYAEDIGGGKYIVYGDVKPSGPYGKTLSENFQDPTRNVSFSLRSATTVTGQRDGITFKKMLVLFTFDAVDGPGYAEACKRYQHAGVEGLETSFGDDGACVEYSASKKDFLSALESFKLAGHESKIVDQRILDVFGCDEVVVKDRVLRRIGPSGYANPDGTRVSLFDHAFGF